MSDKKSKGKRGGTETARRIWLAGIGAYGRAFSEAQGAIKDMTGETSRVFDDLVQKGEFIELSVDAKRKELLKKGGVPELNMPDLKVPELNLDERIAKMRSRLMRAEDVADDISDMDSRLSAMEAKMDRILDLLEAKKTPPKKSTPKKTASKKKST